jgi:hypothetical protein
VSAPLLVALILSASALVVGIVAVVQASRRAREVEGLHERMDEEFEQWREALRALQHRADEAYDRASQPSMPGVAALRLQGVTEAVEDLRQEVDAVGAGLRRESAQRLSTEVALFDALDKLKQSAPAARPAPPTPARKARSSSLFEIVEFGDDTAPTEQ